MTALPRRRAPRKGPKIRRIPPYRYRGAEAKPAQPATQRRGSYETSAPAQPPAQAPAPPKPGTSAASTVAAVLGGLGITFLILYATGFFSIFAEPSGGNPLCPSESGYIKCGYCSEDAATSGNPNAGQCRYCPTGTTCKGSICGEISCVPTGGGTPPGTGGGGAGYCTSDADCRGFGSRNCQGSSLVRCGSDNLCHCCLALCTPSGCRDCIPCSMGCDVNQYCERGACVFKVGGPTNA